MTSNLPAIAQPEEMPINPFPKGKLLGVFENTATLTKRIGQILLAAFIAIAPWLLLSAVFGGVPKSEKSVEFATYILLVLACCGLLIGAVSMYFRAARIRGDIFRLYEDGFVFDAKGSSYHYVWWLNLVSYQITDPKPGNARIVLNMTDGRKYKLTPEYGKIDVLLEVLPRITQKTLADRLQQELLEGKSASFGNLILNHDGLYVEQEYATWLSILKIEDNKDLHKYIIWVAEPVGLEHGEPPVPKRFAVLDRSNVPNRELFLEFMKRFLDYKLRQERIAGKRIGLLDITSRWRIYSLWAARFAAVEAVSFGLVGLAFLVAGISGYPVNSYSSFETTECTMLILLGICGVVLAWLASLSAIQHFIVTKPASETIVALYDDGIVVNSPIGHSYWNWEDIVGYRRVLRVFPPTFPHVIAAKLIIFKTNGQRLVVSNTFSNALTFESRFCYAAVQVLGKRFEETLRQGGVVDFGVIQISNTHVIYKHRRIERSQIIGLGNWLSRHLSVYVGSAKRSRVLVRVPVNRIINGDILVRMIQQIIEMNRSKQ